MKEAYNKSVMAYVKAFEKKQDVTFDEWVVDDVGTIACFDFGSYYIDFQDIKFDIDNNIKPLKFFDYYTMCLNLHYIGKPIINYKNFNKL